MVRILCLHGNRQTAEIFEHQLNKLCGALSGVAELHFVDAPCVLAGDKVDGDAVATRSWCEPKGDGTRDMYAAGDDLLRRCMTAGGTPYDFLLGFSQGGLLAARYVILQRLNGAREYGPPVKGVILAASPDPRRVFPELVASYLQHAPPHDGGRSGFLGAVPSLHIVGRKDTIVDPAESASFAEACKPESELLFHDHAHSIPQLQKVMLTVKSFIGRAAASAEEQAAANREEGADENDRNSSVEDDAESGSLAAAREEELEMVSSMYGEECVQRRATPVVFLPLLLDGVSDAATDAPLSALRLCMTLPRRYPAELPKLEVVGGPADHHVAFERWKLQLLASTLAFLREDLGAGNAMLLPAMMFAGEQAAGDVAFLRSVMSAKAGASAAAEGSAAQHPQERSAWWDANAESESEDRVACIVEAEGRAQRVLEETTSPQASNEPAADVADGRGATSRGGVLELTIGLIGKPSAGKSTFFNAVTDPESESRAARVAAFPFTTIEPNVGAGFGAVFCPCCMLPTSSAQCDAMYGHVPVAGALLRRHPVVIKDVAGLVQGAYKGKGRGNQFLNDLCDANVLVHVVDGAAATNADGSACPPGTGSTCDDIAWVRAEVHSWIYDNLRAKWGGLRRKPEKLRTMFTGYRSPPSFVDGVLRRLGITGEAELMSHLPAWGPAELHHLVALYVRLRFPIVVALNKSDVRSVAGELHAELRRRYPHETFVPMSAKVECQLLRLRHKGLVHYVSGDGAFQATHDGGGKKCVASPTDARALANVRHFFDSAGTAATTGVQEVMAAALQRCPLALVFPTAALTPPLPSLRNCFVFGAGSTAGEVFEALLHANLLEGKLVRFEALCVERACEGREPASLKKDAALPGRHVLVRVLTNKRQLAV
ncbi:uncharacterized protein Tco025E_00636 [Trypanosoma conorhini]|uniref:RWD domain-containing protein n=1 Tax=Trypanosoma conorhini TaxID=83891 RepID=A0A422QB01_9TRYP|nr:uncharacterized protein Tco025E_00636 [Trypanosoma conorhini]RNF27138.1 hypothetical protein Tco025E_00636 [Trypanosoma conorhini]